ncbi:hypothetical protein C2G38_2227190 [Gigaspora rosea]|uniref:CSC1/OSCA1-like 7TM region domain-containing protein n=1 Tax=Gigaspora rosea TaxID=44941 RepID=A0A397U1P4_9GLOM|nr:hypothetical protein C2G38_2227190 [Gigaspora rosea]
MWIQLATFALLVPNLSSPPEGSTLAAIPINILYYNIFYNIKYNINNTNQ